MSAGFDIGSPAATGEQMPNPVRQAFAQFDPGDRRRVSSQGATAHALSADNYNFGDINVPGQIGIGEPIVASAEVNPTTQGLPVLLDPDSCTAQNFSEGTRIDIEVYLDGQFQAEQRYCLPASTTTDPNPGSRTGEFSLPPQNVPGTYDVSFEVHGAASDNLLASTSRSVSVVQEQQCPDHLTYDPDTGQCVDPSDIGNGDNGGNGNGGDGLVEFVADLVVQNPIQTAIAVVALSLAFQVTSIVGN